MAGPTTSTTTPDYQPTAEQLARAARLRRFDAWYVFTPVVAASLLVGVLFVAMIWFTVVAPNARITQLLSATADLLIIITVAPLIILSLLLPAGAVFLVHDARQKNRSILRSVQSFFWRVESIVVRVKEQVERTAPLIARPVIRAHGLAFRVTRTAAAVATGRSGRAPANNRQS